MELYFKLKTIGIILGIICVVVVLLLTIGVSVIKNIRAKRLSKLFENNCFTRYLVEVWDGGHALWGYRKGNIVISDNDIKGLSICEIKEKYKLE